MMAVKWVEGWVWWTNPLSNSLNKSLDNSRIVCLPQPCLLNCWSRTVWRSWSRLSDADMMDPHHRHPAVCRPWSGDGSAGPECVSSASLSRPWSGSRPARWSEWRWLWGTAASGTRCPAALVRNLWRKRELEIRTFEIILIGDCFQFRLRLRLTNWADEVKAGVHSRVQNVSAIQTGLVFQILRVLCVDVVGDRLDRVLVVQRLAVVQRINDGQLQLDASLLHIGVLLDDLNLLVTALFDRRQFAILVQFGEEQRVDQRRLAQSALADHEQRELESFLGRFAFWECRWGSEMSELVFRQRSSSFYWADLLNQIFSSSTSSRAPLGQLSLANTFCQTTYGEFDLECLQIRGNCCSHCRWVDSPAESSLWIRMKLVKMHTRGWQTAGEQNGGSKNAQNKIELTKNLKRNQGVDCSL